MAGLLRACRGEKRKGISAFRIFQYLLCLVFSDRSMYMRTMTGRITEGFCKNTAYRFLSTAKTNWERFVLPLSERIPQKRCGEDDRTIGELFLLMSDGPADTAFAQAMRLIVDAMPQSVREQFGRLLHKSFMIACPPATADSSMPQWPHDASRL